jgi:hypothetical protein
VRDVRESISPDFSEKSTGAALELPAAGRREGSLRVVLAASGELVAILGDGVPHDEQVHAVRIGGSIGAAIGLVARPQAGGGCRTCAG